MISENMEELKKEIGTAMLVVVTKGRSVEHIKEVYDTGHKLFGENKIQEAEEKISQLPKDISWHLVGHLQSNKVRSAIELFHVIQSVDNLKLLEKIDRVAEELGKKQEVMLQVNVSRDPAKFGFSPEVVPNVIKIAKGLKYVDVMGLMTITSQENREEDFQAMKTLFDRFAGLNGLRYLSMGMTDSYKMAIEKGSNMIRIGRKVFD